MNDLPITGANLHGGDVAAATAAAASCLDALDDPDPSVRADRVDSIADALERHAAQIVEAAGRETALGATRLNGEMARTIGQFRTYGAAVRRGDDLDLVATPAAPELARVAMVRGTVAIGPVAVFGAGNFPLAFGAVGTDTAAALAAGCPVVVKAHPSHPDTSELSVRAAIEGLAEHGLAAAISMVHGGASVGAALVGADPIAAVAFTGSFQAGRALMDAAAARVVPIPVFAEMGSVNPIVVSPEAARGRGGQIATAIGDSIIGSAGQLCTKPGVVFVPVGPDGQAVVDGIAERMRGSGPFTLLDDRIQQRLIERSRELAAIGGVRHLVSANGPAEAALLEFDAPLGGDAAAMSALAEEAFGPVAVVVRYEQLDQIAQLIAALGGQLTVTVQAEESELDALRPILAASARHAGRIVWNGVPTGVAVVDAMHHGGPWPASSSAFGSVGPEAIRRFRRPLCWQGFPPMVLHATLRAQNGG